MSRARSLAAMAVLGVLAAFAASPASAARPGGAPAYPELLTTQHFQVHYTGDLSGPPANPNRIVHQTAGDLAALAEQAYSTIVTGWGYPPPLDDGDGKIDIWVQDLSSSGALGLAVPDGAGNTSTAWIAIDPTVATSAEVIAHELFHLIQYATWIPADSWLLEGTAEWAGLSTSGYAPLGGTLADTLAQPDMSLDCVTEACGNDAYEVAGYSRWTFFEYLSERFSSTFVKDVFAKGATLADPLQTGISLVSQTLVSKGTTLADAFTDYTAANVASNYQVAALKALTPTSYSTTPTGTTTGALPVQHVSVNHLAARYLTFARSGSDTAPCYAATLTLTVALPAGIGARPFFYSSSVGTSAIPLSISGSTASLTVPWDTCAPGASGYLSLPNPSSASDSQVFTVSGTLTVDTSAPATRRAPPAPLYTGPTVPSPADYVAPSIYVYGAQIVRVAAANRLVRVIVFSSGPGLLRASAGDTVLGTTTLRAGNNALRFRVPRTTLDSLRRASAVHTPSSLLTLTSLSRNGTAGAKVARKLVLAAQPKPRTAAARR